MFFLDILLHPLTPLFVMMRRRCDRSGARTQGVLGVLCGGGMGCFRVAWGLERKSILREARGVMCG